MKIDEQQKRNDLARKQLTRINEECGVKWSFISNKVGLSSYHSLANWRSGSYLFGQSRLKVVEDFISKYDNMK